MTSKIIVVIVVNVLYLLFCYLYIRARNNRNQIMKQWDNGYEFYASLSESNKEIYWHEDTKIMKIYLLLLLVFIEGTLLLYIVFSNTPCWLILFVIGNIISTAIAIVLSLKLKKKLGHG